ncbi:hypothetical protein FF011L_26100 [Roseimaritima multifibrata]|uniref:DUF58 domain-containing protein n=1 Tax=Roseimaritima multifibrata TaxID=1930274 RepID=A0A517MG43_9BACT|nr:DUF58 domain-containing protein [Roseimaritima multifibrata]QDS93836.1 hypothetical protein FF011L_26100 [Roseimaritima multifibrata]
MTARITISLEGLIGLKAKAHGFSFLPRQPIGSLLSGRHRSRLRGRGLDFEELRHYVQGDDVRAIDWKATARLRSPHIRVFSEERDRPVLLVVDQRQDMFFGSRRAMKSVVACELAALAAWKSLATGDRVGGIVFNNHSLKEIRPHRSQGRILQFLQELSLQNQMLVKPSPEPSTVTLNQALEAAQRHAKHDYLVVLISDLSGADQQTQKLATQIAAHNDMMVVAVYDPLGISLRSQPGMFASANGQRIEVSAGSGFPQAFQDAFEQLLEHWMTIFRALKIPVLPIATEEPVVDQIRQLFGQHGVTG